MPKVPSKYSVFPDSAIYILNLKSLHMLFSAWNGPVSPIPLVNCNLYSFFTAQDKDPCTEDSHGFWCVTPYFCQSRGGLPLFCAPIELYLYLCFSSFHIVVWFCGNGCFVNINFFLWSMRFSTGQTSLEPSILLAYSEAFDKSLLC